jgi:hypothetical protein
VRLWLFVAPAFLVSLLSAQSTPAQPGTEAGSRSAAASTAPSTALTIYNEGFAVARTPIDLDLHAGTNEVSTSQVTTAVEADSVVLRDPTGKHVLQILEQNYDAGVVNQERMLEKYEGKTIQFRAAPFSNYTGIAEDQANAKIISGKIIRAPRLDSRYVPNQPIIESEGHLEFMLPGTPLFPVSTDDLLLKPTLRWEIKSDKAQKVPAELAYITNGISWDANYNVVAPGGGDASSVNASEEKADLSGWVTIRNLSGTDFPAATIKLMAGDVARIQPRTGAFVAGPMINGAAVDVNGLVTQKPFDDFHLYDLHRTVSLLDGETKQVQFIDGSDINLARSYVYDGGKAPGPQYQNYNYGGINQQPNFGLDTDNHKVEIVEQIRNTEANHLGIPLPAGRIRLYRRDTDGQMEFVGESMIHHTPANDTVRITTGSAFDVKGSRRQTDFHINQNAHDLDESFEITVTNQKAQPIEVTIVEHMNRGENWEIPEKSADYTKTDSHTLEFPVKVPAKGEGKLTYSVRYTW